jgi:hypothetical protein
VFDEEPHRQPAGLPDAVPVGVDAGPVVEGGGVLLGPPAQKPRIGVGAGVVVQVDEELVDAEHVVDLAATGDPVGAFDAGTRRLQALVVGVAVGVGVQPQPDRAERVQVRRLGDTGGAGERETVQHVETVQDRQPLLGGAQRVEQRTLDLVGGQQVVLGQPGQQQTITGGETTVGGQTIRLGGGKWNTAIHQGCS